jgi:hypothetical protein
MSKEELKTQAQNEDIELNLQLGDVIQILNHVNEILNNQVFIIDYIDKSKTYLINTDSLERIKLKITEDGVLGDGNITQIDILSRADTPSYARQNGLLPGKWINIYFGGDYPVIITGEITNLEEDMIEVKTTDNDLLYLNFDYKGLPEDLPIENIEIRDKPVEITKKEMEVEIPEIRPSVEEKLEEGEIAIPELEKEKRMVDVEQLQIVVPVKDVKDQLREFIVKADQIEFGDEELGPITQYIDIADKSQRYSIEAQLADLLDELLSTIPNSERTPRVLNNIHIMIERFKQLRENFSYLDQYGNVDGALVKEASYKPLMSYFKKFKQNLYWILPVVKNIKKVYNVDNIDEENNDIINLDLTVDVKNINELISNYKSNNLSAESNKYTALYTELAPYFTPFNSIGDEEQNSIINEIEVNNNINTIIDNLEDMYSSIFSNNMIRNRRFVITKYNLGETKLDITDATSSKMTTIRVPITKNDFMAIKSFLTLPEPTIRFSKINLPGTDILMRANLNQVFLNYWELLKKNTNVSSVFVDSLGEIDFDESTYVNGIRNYILNIPEEDLKPYTKIEIYNSFASTIIPKIRVIFNLMKKYITGKLSIVEVISYLEPFLIYTDDLTFKQYQEIVLFIDEKISNYNKNMIELSRIFKLLSTIKSANILNSKAYSIVEILNNRLRGEVLETSYQIDYSNIISHNQSLNVTFTDSEILRKLVLKDYSKLYTTALAYENIPLMFPKDVSEIFGVEKNKNEKTIGEEEKNDSCENIIIAKLYTSLEQLENDNDKIIYFDKNYDKTNYGIMEDEKNGYAKEVINLTPEKLKEYIINDQIKKNKLTESDALYLTETLINGNKMVIDGQYAVLYNENLSDSPEIEKTDFYVRKDNKWVKNNDLNKNKIVTEQSSILCDLQEKCINVTTKNEDKCESTKINELSLQNQLLNNIIDEFDQKYKVSKQEFEKNIKENFEYFLSIMPIISKIETNNLLKYNNEKYKLGVGINDDMKEKIISPFAELLNIILGQKDFIKKQNDLIRFADKFTREFVPGTSENNHWLYCIKTGVPLLPSFKKELAAAFIFSNNQSVESSAGRVVYSSGTYLNTLERLKATIGQLSDDGDWWTDKYTGWPICPGDFDVEEGFEEGFKVSSRAVLEEDAGNKIMAAQTEKTIKYITQETKIINNLINTLAIAMGISIETQKEFIINCVIESIRNTVESESDYKDKVKTAAQKGKKLPSYTDFFNTSLVFYTFGMFLIGVQTSIPSIRTRKTHPGCVRSFTGYPFDGQGDLSSLTYLACIAYDIRESGQPWNVLKKLNVEKIQSRIKAGIDDYLIQLPEVQRKFSEKTEYLLTRPSTEISVEHDIAQWSDFLPPIIPFKIKHLVNISDEFKRTLKNDLRSGLKNQREKILVIESKIIKFSLAIQERIREIVKRHKVILHTANNEPYLENSCCDSKENESTIDYFNNIDNDILQYNDIVLRLTNILDDIIATTESPLLYSNINTKNIYPSISNTFDEKTIYLAFIFYCKFKSLRPIPEDLLPICTNKPDDLLINQADSIERIITKLKEDGRNYTNEQFLRLIELVSRENIINLFNNNSNINIDNPIISSVAKLSVLLESIYEENNDNEIVEQSLRDLIKSAINTFDIASENITKEVKDLNNFLIKSNEDMTNEIIDFVQKNEGTNTTRSSLRKFINTITNLSTWSFDMSNRNENIKISDDKLYTVINFYKTFIDNFVNVFPNIILNKVNYENTMIPSYYGFSKNHMSKLRRYIADYFSKLKPFYGIPSLLNILNQIQKNGKNLVKLAENTPSFTNIKIGDKVLRGVIDERTSRYLFEYYLLRILINLIEMTDQDDMIVTEIKNTEDITDIFSVDYLQETETRIDLSLTSRNQIETRILTGNKKELRQKVAELLISFIDILRNEKDTIDISYEDIQDRVFKLREREKNMVTDKLKGMTDEGREIDTILKINKLAGTDNDYSKALKKGLTTYDVEFYEEEQNLRDEMVKAERIIRKKNKDANDENIDILIDEYKVQQQMNEEIEKEAYNMEFLGESYYDGNFDGVDAPEEEYQDYAEEY